MQEMHLEYLLSIGGILINLFILLSKTHAANVAKFQTMSSAIGAAVLIECDTRKLLVISLTEHGVIAICSASARLPNDQCHLQVELSNENVRVCELEMRQLCIF